MKKLLILFCSLYSWSNFAQATIFKYEIEVINHMNPPTFIKINNQLQYSGTNVSLQTFFSGKTILHFYQNTPTLKRPENLKIFHLETDNSNLVPNMITTFPTLFSGYIDITNVVYELSYTPNDYGTTSTVTNLGAAIERSDLDYMNVQKAWDLTTGNGMRIGISDARINMTDPDFVNKTTFINPFYTQFLPINVNDPYFTHGTGVAGIAAARGDNSYGSTGICYNCDIVGTGYGNYANLVALADAGIRVINMSWTSSSFNQNNQNIINELASQGVILVAAGGNSTSFQTTTDYHCPAGSINGPYYTGIQYRYPASYDNVIAVSTVSHKYPVILPLTNQLSSYCCDSSSLGGYPIHVNIQGSYNIVIGGNDPYNPLSLIYTKYPETCSGTTPYTSSPNGLITWHSTNPKIDILAPTFQTFNFSKYTETGIIEYRDEATSGATPRVSSTVALMLSLDPCLYHNDVDSIIKLTSKDVTNLPMNILFDGQIGAGALDTGNAVEFVNEARKANGNAIIQNHIFNRFEFNLTKINNNLTIDNVTFKDNCKASFKSKTQIRLLPGTNLKPNATGNTYLSIDTTIISTCAPYGFTPSAKFANNDATNVIKNKVVLYPNPNNGTFNLFNINKEDFGNQTVEVKVFDINGRSLYTKALKEVDFDNCEINLNDFASGIYIVKIASASHSQDIKFVKK